MSLWADDQWWKEMHAPRHPAPPVSEGDALAKAFADYESTREDVARRTDPMRANSLLLAGAGLANAVKDHLAQLQVQAPVGEGLENSVSDGERDALLKIVTNAHQAAWTNATECEYAPDAITDAILAAGYRNRPMPSVDEVACVVADVMRWEDFVAPDVIEPSADCYRIATAVLALFTKESE